LAGLLWPEAPNSLSRKYLRQAIWRLHSSVTCRADEPETNSQAFLIVHPGWIRINPEAAWWLDVAVFEQAYYLYRETPGEYLTDRQAEALEAAVVLYRGDLIEAWYQDWCIYERDRLQLNYLAMLEQLMGHCEARQRYAKGVAYGQCILRYDPARECTHRYLMRLYYRSGDRTTALRQYDRCTSAMAKHFNLSPSRETVALYHQVRSDRLDDSAFPGPAAGHQSGEPGTDLLLGLQTRLDHVQVSLTTLQRQVQQELASISWMLTARRETLDETSCQTS
jgi:DNA-binding SARP family transcriptional activator